jgi:hypothetical protein
MRANDKYPSGLPRARTARFHRSAGTSTKLARAFFQFTNRHQHPFTIEAIKALARAYAPIEKWEFFGKSGHMADLMLVSDKSGRRWIRLSYGEGNPGHPYVVTFELAVGSPNKEN